jgi:hypothetical protein
MVGEISAMDWARTVGNPSAFFRSPEPADGPDPGAPVVFMAVLVPMALTVPLCSLNESE